MSIQAEKLTGLTFSQYEKIEAINNSSLSWLKKSPKHYKYYLENPPEKSSSQIIGQAVHTKLLTPHWFNDEFAVFTDGKTRGSKSYTQFVEKNPGKLILMDHEEELVNKIYDSLVEVPFVQELLSDDYEKEVSCIWEYQGHVLKCRIDLLGKQAIWDVKTTRNAEKKSFLRSILAYGYHRQGAVNVDGMKEIDGIERSFGIISVEKSPPFAVGLYMLDPQLIQEGRQEYYQLLELVRQCEETGYYPGYTDTVDVLGNNDAEIMFAKGEEDEN